MKTVEELIAIRDKYIEEHPHLKEFQDQLDETLDKCVDSESRAQVIVMMIQERLETLRTLATGLERIVITAKQE